MSATPARLASNRLAMREFFAPAPLLAVTLMGLNDHVLKARFHNAVTGKLSDLTACFFLPLFVSAILGAFARVPVAWRLAVGAVTTAVVFVALELSDVADRWFAIVTTTVGAPLGVHRVVLTRDLTDLAAVIMIPLGCAYGWRRLRAGGAS